MSRIIIPNQSQTSNAYQHKLFDFDPENTNRQYISSTISQLLKAVGQNIVLDGLNYTLSFTGTTVIASFSTGQVLIDNMYIDITESVELIYDDANLKSTDGVFVAVLNYQHLQSLENNPVKIAFYYVSANNVVDPVLSSNRSAIVLGIFDFAVQNNFITSFTQSNNYKTTFNDIEYYLGGYKIDNMNLTKLFQNIPDFQVFVNFLRDANVDIVYSFDNQLLQIISKTPFGNVITNYEYQNNRVITECLTFRDVLINTRTYSYDNDDDLISWIET